MVFAQFFIFGFLQITHGLGKHKMSYGLSFYFQYLCRTFPIVDDHVHDAMGDNLYDLFMVRLICILCSISMSLGLKHHAF